MIFKNQLCIYFINGSFGDALYCIHDITSDNGNFNILISSKRIAKKALSMFTRNFSFNLPIGGNYFRKLIFIIFKLLPLIDYILKVNVCIYNHKSFVIKKYCYENKKVKLFEISYIKNSINLFPKKKKRITFYGDYILINLDVDKSVRRITDINSVRPTKLPTTFFFENLIIELKTKYPNYKFIQIGECGNQINNIDINLINKTTLRELVDLIINAKYTITIEGGIRALCILVNSPALAILGPSDQKLLPSSSFVRDVKYTSCSPCWRNTKNWYFQCNKNNNGEAICTSDITLFPQIQNLTFIIQNEIYKYI